MAKPRPEAVGLWKRRRQQARRVQVVAAVVEVASASLYVFGYELPDVGQETVSREWAYVLQGWFSLALAALVVAEFLHRRYDEKLVESGAEPSRFDSDGKRARGPLAAAARQRRMVLTSVLVVGLVGLAVGIAVLVKNESCDVQAATEQERELICALQRQDQPGPCPSVGITPEQCASILEDFSTRHGPG